MQKTFQEAVAIHKSQFRKFLDKVAQNPPPFLDAYTEQIDKEVWKEIDCLSCSNCCRNMSPTYTAFDMKKIATHLRMSVSAFKEKWLYKNKKGEWMNRLQPCQFLDLETNRCNIYDIRPEDCAGFPHLAKKKMEEYMHVHKQNISFCPATFKMVEKLMQLVNSKKEQELDMGI